MSIESIKVRDLNTTSSIGENDLLLVAKTDGTTQNVKISDLLTYVSSNSSNSAGWSSGWINHVGLLEPTAVANSATLSFTHNLDTDDLTFSLFARDTDGGGNSVRVDLQPTNPPTSLNAQFYGAQIQDIEANTVTVQLSSYGVIKLEADGNWDSKNWNTQQIKVVAK
jgi:hypothetical protein